MKLFSEWAESYWQAGGNSSKHKIHFTDVKGINIIERDDGFHIVKQLTDPIHSRYSAGTESLADRPFATYEEAIEALKKLGYAVGKTDAEKRSDASWNRILAR